MEHPLWQKIISYFKDVSLEKTTSVYNPYLEVLLVQCRHQLITKDAIYSFDDKYTNFYGAFKAINWNKLKIENVLVLGLGLGSVIMMLEQKFNKQFSYTALEIDEAICRLAQKYTLDNLASYVEVICSDAMNFLDVTEEKYDMIIMDIFQSALIPKKFQSARYLHLLNAKLNKNGLLLYNRMNICDRDTKENNAFRYLFKNVYPNMTELKIKDNLVFVNDASLIS